jgi:hypothetical protein
MRDDDFSSYDTDFLRIAKSCGMATARPRLSLLDELTARDAVTHRALVASAELFEDFLVVLRLECPQLVGSSFYKRVDAMRAEVGALLETSR